MLSFNNTFKAAIIALVVGARFIAAVPVSGDIAQRDSYSGASSDASGGSVGQSATDNLQLVKILSGNGGNGGTSKTGAAGSSFKDGSDTNTGSSFSGAAGPARGGDAVSNGVVEVLSSNGGNGGKSMSGASGVPVLAGILPIANNVGATPLSPKFSRVLHIRLD